jgi:uncharacterized phiE125 gp8 family phage protein
MRWLEPEVITPPTIDVFPIVKARTQTRREADNTDNDADLQDFIDGSISYVEQYTGLRLATQTLKLRAWGFEDCTFRLPAAPIQSITSITYLDPDGAEQTLDPSIYVAALYGLDPTVSLAVNKQWPAHRVQLGSVTITVVAGYADGALPKVINQALRLMVGDWDKNRETSEEGRVTATEMVAVDDLLTNSRRPYI